MVKIGFYWNIENHSSFNEKLQRLTVLNEDLFHRGFLFYPQQCWMSALKHISRIPALIVTVKSSFNTGFPVAYISNYLARQGLKMTDKSLLRLFQFLWYAIDFLCIGRGPSCLQKFLHSVAREKDLAARRSACIPRLWISSSKTISCFTRSFLCVRTCLYNR